MAPPDPTPPATPEPPGGARVATLLLAVLVGAAVVGFFVGVGQNRAETAFLGVPRATLRTPDVLPSMEYREVSAQTFGPNAHFRNTLDGLAGRPAPGPGQDIDARLDSLAARTARRAYNGAPPTVPHPIDQLSSASCLACHGEGLRIGDVVAHKMPHENYASCTQCHAPEDTGRFEDIPLATAFAGAPAPLQGERAWPGAPPIIPHTIHMRSDCLSCHGPTGRAGMRTTHPERTSCLQCHATSSALDRLPLAKSDTPLFLHDAAR